MLLIGYMGVQNGWLRKVNREARNTFRHHLNNQSADNYLQYLPLACDYGLSALGIKAKHNYGERTIALATSYLFIMFPPHSGSLPLPHKATGTPALL